MSEATRKQVTVYRRVSKATQAENGSSLAAQAAQAQEWAQARGHTVAGIYTDAGLSGRKARNRPGLQEALDEVCESGGVLVFYSLSRLARSVQDALSIAKRLEKAGADMVSLTESHIDSTSAMGRFVFQVLASVAELESNLTSERIRAVKAYLREQGRFAGGEPPYGYRVNGKDLEEDPDEQSVLADLARMRDAGYSWQRIADHLNAGGVRLRAGRRWTWQTTRKAGRSADATLGAAA